MNTLQGILTETESPELIKLSLKEKDRRWSMLREMMKKEGLDATIIFGSGARWMPIRYLTDIYPLDSQLALIFSADKEEEPVLLSSLARAVYFAKRGCWVRPENIHFSPNQMSDLAKYLNEHKLNKKRIGIDSYNLWTIGPYQVFKKLCPDVELVEASELVGDLRAQKSSEELLLIEEAVRVVELTERTFLANLKPGRTEQEVMSHVEAVARANGVETRIWLMLNGFKSVYMSLPGENLIKKENPVAFSSEFHRMRGYFGQAVRTFCWEEPKGEYKRMWNVLEEMRRLALKELRPGNTTQHVGTEIKRLISEAGYECDYYGHDTFWGAGANLTPGPNIRNWTIKPDEVYIIHPNVFAKGAQPPVVWAGDMYLISSDKQKEPKWMTPFLPGLPEIIS
jgi:Xaa-Pro aminopeptidase